VNLSLTGVSFKLHGHINSGAFHYNTRIVTMNRQIRIPQTQPLCPSESTF